MHDLIWALVKVQACPLTRQIPLDSQTTPYNNRLSVAPLMGEEEVARVLPITLQH